MRGSTDDARRAGPNAATSPVVDAGDEKDERHRSQQHDHPSAHATSYELLQPFYLGDAVCKPARRLSRKVLGDLIHPSLSALDRHAVAEPADDVKVVAVAIAAHAVVTAENVWYPHI